MYVVIVGCGRQGARLAQLMEAEGHQVAVVDQDTRSFRRLEDFRGSRILGNAIDIETLRKAGIEKADAFAAVTSGDNTNLMLAQVAQEIFHIPKVVCRVYDPRRAGIYHDLGLQTVCSTTVGARMIRNLLTNPTVLRVYPLGDSSYQAMEMKLGAVSANKTVGEIQIPEEFLISTVIRGGTPFIPKEDTMLQADDQIFAIVKASSVEKVQELLSVKTYAVNFPKK
ncbi:MAG: TrkA family potassium uptake protein [Armatimonadetes bacterium]|nr:TrkA family potassium uptake protein [Armatimonadota bacterium]